MNDADREAKAREDAALAAFKAIYGLNADPFQNENGWQFSSEVAEAVCIAFADATRPQVSDEALSDSDLKDAVTELLGHRGERPYRVLRGGQVLWETWLPAFRAAVRYLPDALRTQPSQAIPDHVANAGNKVPDEHPIARTNLIGGQGNLQGNLAGSTDVQSGEAGFHETGGSCKAGAELRNADLREAIRKAKLRADEVYGIAWHQLEEISQFELVLAALAAPHPIARADDGEGEA